MTLTLKGLQPLTRIDPSLVLEGILINVKHYPYNALGDGANDDTAEIQSAIDACETLGGGVVYFPPGTYKTTGLTVGANHVRLKGAGRASRIAMSAATGNTLTFDNGLSGGTFASYLQGTGIESVVFEPTVTRTAGYEIFAPHYHGIYFNDLYFLNVYGSIGSGRSTDLCAVAYINNIRMYGFFLGVKAINSLEIQGTNWSLDHNTGADDATGIWLSGGVEGFVLTNFDILNSYSSTVGADSYTLRINNDAGTATPASFNKFTNGYFDGGSTGAFLEDGEFNSFTSVWFHGYLDAGLTITGDAANTKVVDAVAIRCGTDGVFVNTTGSGTAFTNFSSVNNNMEGGGGHGFDIASGGNVTMEACRAGTVTAIPGNGAQQFGLKMAAGVVNCTVTECDFRNNGSGAYSILATGETNIFKNNTTEFGVGDYVRSYRSTNQSILNNTNTTILFDTDTSDPNSMHDTATNTGRFVALTPGFFDAACTVQFAAHATGYRQVAAVKHNSDGTGATVVDIDTEQAPHATNPTILKLGGLRIYLLFGQYIEFWALQTSGGALNIETAGIYAPSASLTKI